MTWQRRTWLDGAAEAAASGTAAALACGPVRLLLSTETPLVATRLLSLATSALSERDAALAQLAQLRQTLAEPRDADASDVGEATRDWQRLLLTLVATLGP